MSCRFLLACLGCLLLAGCSVGTHNFSKGTCHDIQVCQDGQCVLETEIMVKSHCDMLGGRFEPRNHLSGWFNF